MELQAIRHFNRDLTSYLGVYDRNLFGLHYPMLALRILLEVNEHPGLRANDLVHQLHVDKGYLSRVIKTLVKDGHLTRRRNPADRRQLKLYVTQTGHQLTAQVDAQSDGRVAAIMNQLSPGEQARVQATIRLLQTALNRVTEGRDDTNVAD